MPDREKVIKGLEEAEIMLKQAVDRGGAVMGAFKCYNRVSDALALLKGQQQEIWELQDQVEYLTDKQKEQETKGKNRLPYSPDSNVQWT